MRHHMRNALAIGEVSLCLFGFGFLAGLTVNAPWGSGPAALCALGAIGPAAFLLHYLRRQGRLAGMDGDEAANGGLAPALAYGIAVALGLAGAVVLLASPAWTGAVLFWPACFGLLSAGFTVYGDARAQAGRGHDEIPGPDSAETDESAESERAMPSPALAS